jgi:hypothetical protein
MSALSAGAALALHFVGMVAHRSYLSYWGLDAGLFPKANDWVLMNGYYSIFHRSVAALNAIYAQLLIFPLVAVLIALYVSFLLSPTEFGANRVFNLVVEQVPVRFRGFVRRASVVFLITLILPLVLFALTAFLAVPALLGETAGTAIGEQHSMEFSKGCAKSRQKCIELKRNGSAIATGYVIDSSTAHIAIFDTDLNRARSLPRDGVEVVAVPVQR